MADGQKKAPKALRDLRGKAWMGRLFSFAGLVLAMHACKSSHGIVGRALFVGLVLWWIGNQQQLWALGRATHSLMTRLNMPEEECDSEKSFWRL